MKCTSTAFGDMIAYLESEIQKLRTEIDRVKERNEKRVD